MSKTTDLMDAARAAKGWASDYQLAKATGISEADLSAYRKGKQHANTYACLRLAIELDLDPALVIAEVALDREKNPSRLAWFRSFLQRAVLRTILIAGLFFSGFYGQDAHAGTKNPRFYFTYSHICALFAWFWRVFGWLRVSPMRQSSSVTSICYFPDTAPNANHS